MNMAFSLQFLPLALPAVRSLVATPPWRVRRKLRGRSDR
jgi:hypothetical protein